MSNALFDIPVTTIKGEQKTLADFGGKAVLVVNTASKCGFTPQYKGLENVWQQYKDKGLVVLGFPCNQFGSQDPGSNGEIGAFCQRNYGVTFPMMSKISVKGNEMEPLYKYLTQKSENGVQDSEVEWNFHKYLINKNGQL